MNFDNILKELDALEANINAARFQCSAIRQEVDKLCKTKSEKPKETSDKRSPEKHPSDLKYYEYARKFGKSGIDRNGKMQKPL